MFDAIIKFSIYNKIIIILATLGLIAWGGYSLSQLPIDALPDVTNNQVQIITVSPTLAAQEAERFITYPIELAMASLPELAEIRSISRFGLSVVTVVFNDEVEMYLARQWVSERLLTAREQIPTDLGKPEIAPPTTGLGEIYQYTLKVKPELKNKYSPTELRSIQDWLIKRPLLGTAGVAEVSSFGGFLKEYEVALSPDKMREYGVTFADVFHTLENNNQNTGGAYIEKGTQCYFIRGLGLLESLSEIERLPIKNMKGAAIRISAVAQVRFGHAARYGALTQNGGGEVVGGIVLMRKGENSEKVITAVKTRMAEIERSLPEGVKIEAFLDRSRLIDTAIETVRTNLLEGGLIVVFTLVLLLGSLRAGLLVASVIPLAMLFAVAMMRVFDVSGNLMSLGAIDFGLIVDGAVIIVESLLHRLSHSGVFKNLKRLPQTEFDAVVFEETKRIRQSAAFGEIIILIVYLPILALSGIEGKMFKPMAQTVSFAILGALILSLTYVPMAAALFLNKKPSDKPTFADKIMTFATGIYEPFLRLALRFKYAVLGLTVILFGGALWVFLSIGGVFIPTLEEGDMAVQMSILPGSSLTQSIQTSTEIEKILLKEFPEIRNVVSKIGSSEIPTDPMSIETGDIMIILKDKKEWVSAQTREELVEKMEKALSVLPGVSLSFQQPIQMRFNELMTGAKTDIAVQFYGEELDTLAALAQKASNVLAGVEGATDVYVEKVTGLPQIVVKYKDAKLAQYNLDRKGLNDIIRSSYAGAIVGQIYEGEKRYNLTLRLAENYRKDIRNIREQYIDLPNGAQIPLSEVADVIFEEGPMQISRENTRRRITIGFNVRNRDVESVAAEVETKLDGFRLPVGYTRKIGGEFENLVHAKKRLAVAVPVALTLIFVLLYFTLRSLGQTVLIFTAIPLSAIGGVLGLWARDMPFSISAGVGFIALFGVAVLNGIVLISHYNALAKETDLPPEERTVVGAKDRLRAVLVTALTASLGFIPMALSTSGGAEVQRPLATVVIGGLLTATFLTLFILPILYFLTQRNSKHKIAITSVLTFFIFCFGVNGEIIAQSRKLTPEDAGALAAERAPDLAPLRTQVLQAQKIEKTAFDLAPASAMLSGGNINVLNAYDYSLTLNQSFAAPAYYMRLKEFFQAQTHEFEIETKIRRRLSAYEGRRLAYELLYYQNLIRLYAQFDTLLGDNERGAEKRLAVGEGNRVEFLDATARRREMDLRRRQTVSDVATEGSRLAYLIGEVAAPQIVGELRGQTAPLSPNVADNPQIERWEQSVRTAERNAAVVNAGRLPGLEVGYLNQSIEKKTGAHVLSVGITAPLNFSAQKSKVEAARLGVARAQQEKEAQTARLQTELYAATNDWQKYEQALRYYDQTGLALAKELRSSATLAFRAGEIEYVAYVQFLTQALQIERDYLENVRRLNAALLLVKFLGGEE